MYKSLSFLDQKVSTQFEEQTETEHGQARYGRVYSARMSLLQIREYPLAGIGLYEEDRYLSKEEKEIGISGSSNGVVDFALKHGIIVWFLYFMGLFVSLKRYCLYYGNSPSDAKLYMLPIIAVGFAQNPFNSPVYFILVYVFYYW